VYFERQPSSRYGGLLAEFGKLLRSFHTDFTRFMAICVMYSFYNGLRKCDGFCVFLSFFLSQSFAGMGVLAYYLLSC